VVPATETQRIQEVQLLVIHLLCELVEAQLLTPQEPESTERLGSWELSVFETAGRRERGMNEKTPLSTK
jgi:D-inositol-3-phosphate glycosyltransferase